MRLKTGKHSLPGGRGRAPRAPREEGAVVKDWGGRLPVALIYPNDYFLGMSNLGIHTIYRMLNDRRDVVCERVFLDSNASRPPLAIESGRPLTDFAVLAFSVSYELDYFNIAAILKASGIPPYAADRDESHPLVIAGGPCITANPMPLSPLLDCCCIGEAEAILPPMLPVLREGIAGARADLLKALAASPGCYVPAYPPSRAVIRQFAPDLDAVAAASVVLTPDTELGDLFLVEAERGCQRGCRFCMVSGNFSPMRFRSAASVVRHAEAGKKLRDRIGLVGPAVTDHPEILDIINGIHGLGAELSVSSLRIGPGASDIIAALAHGNAKTVTIAPEAGSERLRQVIRKGITEDDIMATVDAVAAARMQQLKCYFIAGLPQEEDDDIEAMVRLVLAIRERLDRAGTRLTVNVSPFVPKAGTPFQWLPMASPETLERRFALLRAALPRKGIKLNEESPVWSRVQGILSRGDARLAPAIFGLEKMTQAAWKKAIEKYEIDVNYYVNEKWDTAAPLPWSVVDSGISLTRLCAELDNALKGNPRHA